MRWEFCAQSNGTPETEVRLLAEAGFWVDARATIASLLEGAAADPELLGLDACLAHRTGAITEALVQWKALSERRGPEARKELALWARLSEATKDRRSLLHAERVLSHLAAAGRFSAHPVLVHVRRALGDGPGAEEAEATYEQAFRKRMHWLSPHERIAALEGRPVGADRLGRLDLPPAEGLSTGTRQGIALLAAGSFPEARAALASSSPGWKAASLLAAGDPKLALREAEDALLSRGLDGPLASVFAEAVVAAGPGATPNPAAWDVARRSLERMVASGRPDTQALLHLARLAERGGDLAQAREHLARHQAARDNPWPPPGVVRSAAVYALPGRKKGLIHDVIARRLAASGGELGRLLDEEIHGELAPGAKAQIRRIFAGVREWLVAKHPEQVEAIDGAAYGLHVTKEDEPSGGPSLGLPVAVAFASAMLGIRVPSELAFTGALSYDAAGRLTVLPVGDVGPKLKATLHAGARTLVVPAAQREEALSGAHVPRRIAAEAVAPVATLDDVLELVRRHGATAD